MKSQSTSSFTVVSMGKFTLLFVMTLGLYTVFWFYQNWVAYEQQTGRRVFKLGRAVFSVLFVHELYQQIEKQNQQLEQPFQWSAPGKARLYLYSAVLYVLFFFVAQGLQIQGVVIGVIATLVTGYMQFASMYTAQLVINRVGGDPFGRSNSRYTMGDRLLMVFGIYMWLSFLNGLYLQWTGQISPMGDVIEIAKPPTADPAAVETN